MIFKLILGFIIFNISLFKMCKLEILRLKRESTIDNPINIAFNKPSYPSSIYIDHYSYYCLDGNKDSYCQLGTDNFNWFVVDLLQKYQIQYVIVYSTTCCHKNMDNFIVGLTNNFDPMVNTTIRGNYELCGQWSTTALYGGQPMRVNCANKNIYSRYVIIQQDLSVLNKTGDSMWFNELEVYVKENYQEKYLGCFKSFKPQRLFYGSTLETCMYMCNISKEPYAAIKGDSECYCGSLVGPSIPSSQCIPKCNSVGQCSGADAYTVYLVNKVLDLNERLIYLGCYTSFLNWIYDLETSISFYPLTVENCTAYCFKKGFLYAGLQNQDCNCGNTFGKFEKKPDSECNYKCSGNTLQQCGGYLKNSIYSTCYTYVINKNCSEIYHCFNDTGLTFDRICESGKCEPGWKGDACDKRNCSTNNGNCGIHQCTDFNMGTMNISECVCKDGYQKSYFNDDCIDENECTSGSHKCNLTNSLCRNTLGSYDCLCFPGFHNSPENITVCTDLSTERQTTEYKSVMIAFIVISIIFVILTTVFLALYLVTRKSHKKLDRFIQLVYKNKTDSVSSAPQTPQRSEQVQNNSAFVISDNIDDDASYHKLNPVPIEVNRRYNSLNSNDSRNSIYPEPIY